MEDLNNLGNLKINKAENYIFFSVNPSIFSLEVVYSAAYIMIDKAYIFLDGNPKRSIDIEIRAKKENQDLKRLALEFNNELINYANYKQQNKENKEIREMILQRALQTNLITPEYTEGNIKDPKNIKEAWSEDKRPKKTKNANKRKTNNNQA